MKTKKTLLVSACIPAVIFILPCLVFATVVGNTGDINALRGKGTFSLKEARNVSIETGFDIDGILSRKLSAGDATKAELRTSEWYMFRVGYKMFDRVEPYVRLGIAHLNARWYDALSGTQVQMDTSSNFAWGLGVKGLIYELASPKLKITGDASYRTADLDPYKGYFDGHETRISTKQSRFIIREWQLALLASTDADLGEMFNRIEWLKGYRLSPYGGIKYSQVSGRLRLVTSDEKTVYHPDNIKSERTTGMVVGCDLVGPGDSISLNLEGRFIDETAISAGLDLLF